MWVGFAAVAFVLVMPTPASAKLPFSVEVSPETPTAGEAIEITVRFWDDEAHTDPARGMRHADEFIWAVPAGPVSAAARGFPIDFVRRGKGVFHARVTLPTAGRWNLCAWAPSPCPEGSQGFPTRVELSVADPVPRETATLAREAGVSPPDGRAAAPVAMAAAAVIAAAGVFGVRRLRRPEGHWPARPPVSLSR
jgi:hypothetical protein